MKTFILKYLPTSSSISIQSLRNLFDMINEALILKESSSISFEATWDYLGYYFKLNSDRREYYWIGIRYDQPNILMINTDERISEPVIEDKYANLGLGTIHDGYWIHELDLSAEDVNFFTLSKIEQLQCIEYFIHNALNALNKIKA